MNTRHRTILSSIFHRPTKGDIRWDDAAALLEALGSHREEGRGSRVRFSLNGVRMVLHRPHPGPVMKKGAVDSLRAFLVQAGVSHEQYIKI